MKTLSIALAAALLTAAPIAFAQAEEAAAVKIESTAPVEATSTTTTTTETTTTETTKSVTLADGTVVQIEGDMVYVVDSYGEKKAAPDGDHKAADGTTIVVKDGKLVVTPAADTPVEVKPAE